MQTRCSLEAAALLLLLWLQTTLGYVQLRQPLSAATRGALPLSRRRLLPALKARKSPPIAKDGSLNIRPFEPAGAWGIDGEMAVFEGNAECKCAR
jgi:hypothetical protein